MSSRRQPLHTSRNDFDADDSTDGKTWHPIYTLAEFRQSQLLSQRGDVGPNSYRPDVTKSSTCRQTPSVSFPRSARFAQGSRVYISRHHTVDMLGQQSPGPKYNPALPKPQAHVVSWGTPPSAQLTQTAALEATAASRAGPATYTPNINAVKVVSPAHSFAPADFHTFESRRQALSSRKALTTEQDGKSETTTLPPLANILASSKAKPTPLYSFPRAGQYAKQPRGVPMGSAGRDMLLMTSSYVDEDRLTQDSRSQASSRMPRSDQDGHEQDGRMKLLPRSAPSHSVPDSVRLIPHPPKWASPHRHAGGRPKQYGSGTITRAKM